MQPSDCSLREAIDAAQNNAGADTIKLKRGKTYTLTMPASGDLASILIYRNGPLTITGHAATINGNGVVTANRVFEIGGSTTVTLEGVTVEGGIVSYYGGGIDVEAGSTLDVFSGAINGNTSQNSGGGGIYNDGGTVTLHRVNVEGNQGAISVGGGIDTASNGTTMIYDSRFFDNHIDGGGAALGSTSNAQVTVIRSQLTYNTAGDNGGAVYDSGGAHYDFVNTTINNNTAPSNGGGIRIFDGFVTLKNSTVTRNSAGDGGGIATFWDGTGATSYVTLANTILAANVDSDTSGGSTPDCSDQGSGELFHSSGYNIIGDVTGCTYLAISPASGDQLGTSLSPIDPKLKNEAFNGGNFVGVETFALKPASPAINAGNPATSGGCESTDARGVPRKPRWSLRHRRLRARQVLRHRRRPRSRAAGRQRRTKADLRATTASWVSAETTSSPAARATTRYVALLGTTFERRQRNDTLNGGPGHDTCIGGPGTDRPPAARSKGASRSGQPGHAPGIPDVEGFRRFLCRHARRRKITRPDVLDPVLVRNTTPRSLERALTGHHFGDPWRHGKWLIAPAARAPARPSAPRAKGPRSGSLRQR